MDPSNKTGRTFKEGEQAAKIEFSLISRRASFGQLITYKLRTRNEKEGIRRWKMKSKEEVKEDEEKGS